MKSCLTMESSVSSSSTTFMTWFIDHSMPAMGPVTGQKRTCLSRPIAGGQLVRFLQLQLDVHEVVRWPGARVLEAQQVLVLAADFLDPLVEGGFLRSVDQEGSVQDHQVADRLV